ncbi:putative TFB2-TFIIH subunit [Microstroma glucosiphilum]|uniref:RNA polymerase II transcription factor B subunit 2 n=1 Tax=Pseudomicrostroma glucosiphilum TaxID=1684307 RepID=A0A316U3S4_9BASI|nr:putative TFB2-TFIIH subunit [Pseudomicrostroma glucosiphilum]PWN19820.1 putative TFB2-TFIIH subunit [Pseudomicrostroma glucosiphilum]
MAAVAEPAKVARAPGQGSNGAAAALSGGDQNRAVGFGNETINDFLDRQPAATLRNLYNRPSNTLAVFRLLPPMARQLVMHLLFLDAPLALDQYLVWIKRGEGKRQHEEGLRRLERLHIIILQASKLTLSAVFRDSLRTALMGGGEHRSFGVPSEQGTEDRTVDVAMLDEYARNKWESILHFMVGSEGAPSPGEAVLYLLRRSDLMQRVEDSNRLGITSRGFQFLLEDVNTQLWDILLQYLSLSNQRRMDIVDILSFLFMLGSLTLGQSYSAEDLPESQLHCLQDFADYGLVYQTSPKHFYPTRLATTLTNHDAQPLRGGSGSDEEQGFIVLETNYRLYAYTSNPLRIAVLQLFTHIKARFSNLVLGSLTRDSIKAALAKGISAEQVIAYLSHHAHPQMIARNDPLLPITVTDQVRLWEREKNRVAAEEGYLYMDFSSAEDFKLVRDYAKSLSVLLWQEERSRRFFVEARGQEPVRDFIRRRLA